MEGLDGVLYSTELQPFHPAVLESVYETSLATLSCGTVHCAVLEQLVGIMKTDCE